MGSPCVTPHSWYDEWSSQQLLPHLLDYSYNIIGALSFSPHRYKASQSPPWVIQDITMLHLSLPIKHILVLRYISDTRDPSTGYPCPTQTTAHFFSHNMSPVSTKSFKKKAKNLISKTIVYWSNSLSFYVVYLLYHVDKGKRGYHKILHKDCCCCSR